MRQACGYWGDNSGVRTKIAALLGVIFSGETSKEQET